VATPLGSGGLGVVRLSGPHAFSIADRLFQGTAPLTSSPSHTLHHGALAEGSTLLDDVVAGTFRSPRSYTGEDVVEFSCHGGAHVLRRVLESCLRAGARLADPGEFTRRAFLNGKMDLSQAEAVGDLIAARSDAQRRLALNALRGDIAKNIHPLRNQILDLVAHLEAHLDFVEDEVPLLTRTDIRKKIESTEANLHSLVGAPGRGRLWREGIKIAIVGRPNVGKSSLFNALLSEDRAIVTDQPGTTRDTLEESLVWEGVSVTLVDTAGLRPTKNRVEQEGTDRARRALETVDLAFLVVDANSGPLAEDRGAAEAARDRPVILVLNKLDLFQKRAHSLSETGPLEEKWLKELGLSKGPAVFVSSVTGEGLENLRRVTLLTAGEGQEPREPGIVFNARQEQRLSDALKSLARARQAAEREAPEEVLVIELRLALAGLNAVTGQGAPEEVLDAIFSRFCVGK
jgi:tRNA modification GTPase